MFENDFYSSLINTADSAGSSFSYELLLIYIGHTPLYVAAKVGNIDLTVYLLHQGADFDYQVPSDGRTPLHGMFASF